MPLSLLEAINTSSLTPSRSRARQKLFECRQDLPRSAATARWTDGMFESSSGSSLRSPCAIWKAISPLTQLTTLKRTPMGHISSCSTSHWSDSSASWSSSGALCKLGVVVADGFTGDRRLWWTPPAWAAAAAAAAAVAAAAAGRPGSAGTAGAAWADASVEALSPVAPVCAVPVSLTSCPRQQAHHQLTGSRSAHPHTVRRRPPPAAPPPSHSLPLLSARTDVISALSKTRSESPPLLPHAP
eukprot:1712981-Prymnesium_polylepis.1